MAGGAASPSAPPTARGCGGVFSTSASSRASGGGSGLPCKGRETGTEEAPDLPPGRTGFRALPAPSPPSRHVGRQGRLLGLFFGESNPPEVLPLLMGGQSLLPVALCP